MHCKVGAIDYVAKSMLWRLVSSFTFASGVHVGRRPVLSALTASIAVHRMAKVRKHPPYALLHDDFLPTSFSYVESIPNEAALQFLLLSNKSRLEHKPIRLQAQDKSPYLYAQDGCPHPVSLDPVLATWMRPVSSQQPISPIISHQPGE